VAKPCGLFARLSYRVGQLGCPGSSPCESVVDAGGERARIDRQAAEELELLVRIARSPVDRNDGGRTERVDDREVTWDVRHADLDCVQAGATIGRCILGEAGRDA
jgi:hypothetical protein